MSEHRMVPSYFAPRSEREVLDEVANAFPYPLALTYTRLQAALEQQEPVAAAWQLRDAFECVLKFVACLASADCLRVETDPTVCASLVGRLLKPQGLSTGDWHAILEDALLPLASAAREGRLDASSRLLASLFPIFFESGSRKWRRSALNQGIFSGDKSFVRWRNMVFGHGVFHTEPAWYAAQTLEWLPKLHALYAALAPVLAEWRLVSTTVDEEEIVWQGAVSTAPPARHEHEPVGTPVSLDLIAVSGTHPRLSLAPFLSIQQSGVCGEPAVFFLDKRKPPERLDLLEYERGHLHTTQPWDAVRQLLTLLPPGFKWERGAHDLGQVAEGIGTELRGFETEYVRPGYVLDQLWRVVGEQARGYILLTGQGGTGKTYLVRGLVEDGRSRGITVLAYHIMEGALTDYRTFVTELADMVKATLKITGLQEIQTNVGDHVALRLQVANYLRDVIRLGRLDALVLAIDGLDELSEPVEPEVVLTTLLPAPSELPEGCTVVLTTRDRCCWSAGQDLIRLQLDATRTEQGDNSSAFTRLAIDPCAIENREMVRQYLERTLPRQFRGPEQIAAVLERSGGIYLYAYHLCGALASGAFSQNELPTAEEFYPSYLARLRGRVGPELYTRTYLPILLLLSVVQQPVTLFHLRRWGIADERLRFALLDLRDFLRMERARPAYESFGSGGGERRSQIAHTAFVRFVRGSSEFSQQLREAHATIGRVGFQTHVDGWQESNPQNDEDLYDLLYVPYHLDAGGLADLATRLSLDGTYATACYLIAGTADDLRHYPVALTLYHRALFVCRSLVDAGHADVASDLATTLTNQGIVLAKVGRFDEALAGYDESLRILRPLVAAGRGALLPSLATALMNRSSALHSMGHMNDARTGFGEAIATFTEALDSLPTLDQATRRTLWPDAGRRLQKSLVGAYVNRANLLADQGLLEEALADYGFALASYSPMMDEDYKYQELAPDIATALGNRATVLHTLRRLDEALADLDQAL